MNKRKKDMTGMKFGRLTVLEEIPERSRGSVVWTCRCDCGIVKDISGANLRSGNTESCGCLHRSYLVGKQFGHLVVIAELPDKLRGNIMWLCECSCGNFRGVSSTQLNIGRVSKCGRCQL